MGIALLHGQIASKARSELTTIASLAEKKKLGRTDERAIGSALHGLLQKTSEHLDNFNYPVAGNVRSLSRKCRELFGHGPYDVEKLENGRFAAVSGRLGKPVALASVLSAVPGVNVGMLSFPGHTATTINLGGKTLVLDYGHNTGTPLVKELEEYRAGLIEAATSRKSPRLRALANWFELSNHTAPEKWIELALTHVDGSQISKMVSAITYYNTSYAHEEAGAKARELEHLLKARRLFPDDQAVHNNLAVALFFKRGNTYGKALGHYLRAAKINPYDADVWANIAESYRHLGKPKAALSACNKALALVPNHDVATEELPKIKKMLS